MTTEQEPKRESKREPRALSSEYHKARKQLMLWAGILLVWEFVGIDLEKAKEAEGYAGALIKSIKSPQAVPWVLLVLVGYFIFKLTIEWYQCNPVRRRMRVARIDFISAWFVSLLAYVLYFAQAISRVQFADVLQQSKAWQSLIIGVISITPTAVTLFRLLRERKDIREYIRQAPLSFILIRYMFPFVYPAILLPVLRIYLRLGLNWPYVLLGFTIMFILAIITFVVVELRSTPRILTKGHN
jgi:hypothetical protein